MHAMALTAFTAAAGVFYTSSISLPKRQTTTSQS